MILLAFSSALTKVVPAASMAASASGPEAVFAKGSGMTSMAAMALLMAFRTSVSVSGLTDFTYALMLTEALPVPK